MNGVAIASALVPSLENRDYRIEAVATIAGRETRRVTTSSSIDLGHSISIIRVDDSAALT